MAKGEHKKNRPNRCPTCGKHFFNNGFMGKSRTKFCNRSCAEDFGGFERTAFDRGTGTFTIEGHSITPEMLEAAAKADKAREKLEHEQRKKESEELERSVAEQKERVARQAEMDLKKAMIKEHMAKERARLALEETTNMMAELG